MNTFRVIFFAFLIIAITALPVSVEEHRNENVEKSGENASRHLETTTESEEGTIVDEIKEVEVEGKKEEPVAVILMTNVTELTEPQNGKLKKFGKWVKGFFDGKKFFWWGDVNVEYNDK